MTRQRMRRFWLAALPAALLGVILLGVILAIVLASTGSAQTTQPGVTVSPTEPFLLENGDTAPYTVVLDKAPTGTVTISVTSSLTTAATVDPSSLTFTTQDWDTPQSVTITGVNDNRQNFGGPLRQRTSTISHSASGGGYDSVTVSDVTVGVLDDELYGATVSVTSIAPLRDSVNSLTVQWTLVPDATSYFLMWRKSGQAYLNQAGHTAMTTNRFYKISNLLAGTTYDVLVTAVEARSGFSRGQLGRTAVSGTTTPRQVTLSKTLLSVAEDGGTDTFTARLRGQPSGDVTVSVASSDSDTATVKPSSLTFTSDNYWRPQTVTVTGQDDDIDNTDDQRSAAIQFTPSGGGYGSTDGAAATVTVTDDDTAVLTLSKTTLSVAETGGTETYTVKLATEPTGDVTVTPSSSDTAAATVSAALTFTSDNYSTEQTVTVTGVNDDVDNAGDKRSATVSHTVSGGGYGSVAASDVSVSVTDDDTAATTVSPTSVSVSEVDDGDTTAREDQGTYTVELATEPTGDVTVTPSSSDTTAATVSAPLTFTSGNWDTAQTVTVTGQNDDIDNANDQRSATVSHMISGDGYGSVTISDVSVTVTDDDAVGVTVSETALTVAEIDDGDTTGVREDQGTYTVVLDSEPSADVTVTVAAGTGVGVDKTALTFTMSNWSDAQTVTVTAQDDDIDNPMDKRTATVSHTVSDTGGYDTVTAGSVTVTVTDDDTAGITVSPASVSVAENGGTANYTVKLDSEPTADVTVTPASTDTGAATVSGALTFTSGNWDTAQTVTVTGQNDNIDNAGNQRSATIGHTASGGGYGSVTADVSVSVTDDDGAGITVSPTSVSVAEAGGTGTYTIKLNTEPTDDVTVTPSSDSAAATVSGALTFTSSNYSTAQTVTVTGQNDDIDNTDDKRSATVSHEVSGGGYGSVSASDVSVSVTDDDTAGVTVSKASVSVAENGGTATYTVKLNSEPTADVTVTPSSSPTSAATVSAALTFTSGNWDTAQTVTVTGKNDDIDNANDKRSATVSHTVSDTGGYDSVSAADVSVSVTDDDTAGVSIMPATLTVAEVDDGDTTGVREDQGTYTVVLDSEPTADVTVTVAAGAGVGVDKTALTFTMSDWDTAQTVTVTGQDDDIDNAMDKRTVSVSHTVSDTGGYDSVVAGSVTVTVTDDDTAGITVSKASVSVAENGGTETYTVKLNSEPTANVTVTPSSNSGAATVSGALTFTSGNWGTEQTVTVTGQNDDIDNASDRSATVSHTVSDTGGYDSVTAADVSVSVTDDDAAGITVSEMSVSVAENGGTATYTVKLNSEPTANVTVTPESGTTSAATVSGALTFTTGNWGTAQTVTVTGKNDDVDNAGDKRSATVSHTVSDTGGYDSVTAASVAVSVTDDDTAGVTVSPKSVSVVENAGTATYTVKLNTEPTANVTVTPASSDTGVATVSGILTFTSGNWSTEQTVTVTGQNDNIDNASNRSATISHTVSDTGGYDSVSAADVAVSVTDDDSAGITVSPTSVSVGENGGTGTYTIKLNTAPTGNVTVTPSSDTTSAATVSGALTFTSSNYSTAQTVTVTGQNDDIDNASNRSATVSHEVSGGGYGSVGIADVSVSVTDDDGAGVTVSKASVSVAEAGGTATYTVKLNSEPTADVTVTPASNDTGAATVSGALTFTSSNYSTAQTVTVTGQNDDVDNAGDKRSATVSHTVSDTGGYDSVSAADVSVSVTDDDAAAITVSPVSVSVAENGGTGTYTVKLNTQPTGNVTITPSSNSAAATVSGALTFTSGNYSTEQTVTVTGQNDDIDNAGNRSATVSHTVSGGGYGSVSASDVSVSVTDDDAAGVTVSKASVSVAEAGGTETYTIKLNSEPTASVTVTPSSNSAAATVSGALTFTSGNWGTAQTVTVTGKNDDVDNASDRSATISHTVSDTGGYDSVSAADVSVSVTDDDAAGITVSKASVSVAENGGTATYTVKLNSEPTANVTVTPESGTTSAATVSGPLTFTSGNWGTEQTVTVTGQNDDVDNAGNRSATISHTVSDTGGYDSVSAADVSVSVTDDDTAGVTVSPKSVSVVENAGTATYTVKLNTEPTADVTVTPNSNNTGAATVSGPLTFTSGNWGTEQTVTVTGKNDDVDNAGDKRSVTVSHTVSDTGGYDSVTAADVSVSVTDDDGAGVTVSPTSLSVAENAGTGTYTVRLNTEPTGDVTVTPSSNSAAATVSGALTFTSGNYSTAQTVTVTGQNDNIDNAGDKRSVTVSHSISGGGYGSVPVSDVSVSVTDDDGAGITVSPASVSVAENGGTGTYTVRLNSEPTGDVTVTPASSDTGAATVSGPLTFTTGNWSTAQTVTVTGQNDDIDNAGDKRSVTVSHRVSGGGYGSVPGADVSVSVTDDDAAPMLTGLTVGPVEGDTTKLRAEWDPMIGASEYQVEYKTDGGSYGPASRSNMAATVETIPGMNAGTRYTVRVTAMDDGGMSMGDGEASGSTLHALGTVTVSAPAGHRDRLRVSWSAVPGAVGYRVEYKTGAGSYRTWSRSDDAALSETITGLNEGTQYTVRVTVLVTIAGMTADGDSAEGSGTTNRAQVDEGQIGPPERFFIIDDDSAVDLLWQPPLNTGGAADVTYEVRCRRVLHTHPDADGSVCESTDWTVHSVGLTTRWPRITGLTNGNEYRIQVRAVNANFASRWTNTLIYQAGFTWEVARPGRLPGAPTGVTVEPTASGGLEVSWVPPTDTGDIPIRGYLVRFCAVDDPESCGFTGILSGPNSMLITTRLNHAYSGVAYRIWVEAHNTRGETASADVIATMPSQMGLTVSAVAYEPTKLEATWQPLAGASRYRVEYKTADGSYSTAPRSHRETNETISGLSAATAYTVRVTALDSDGTPVGYAVATATTDSRSVDDDHPLGYATWQQYWADYDWRAHNFNTREPYRVNYLGENPRRLDNSARYWATSTSKPRRSTGRTTTGRARTGTWRTTTSGASPTRTPIRTPSPTPTRTRIRTPSPSPTPTPTRIRTPSPTRTLSLSLSPSRTRPQTGPG